MADLIQFPGTLRISGISRLTPRTLEIVFDRAVSDDQLINFWLMIKNNTVASTRPLGWEPSDKSSPDDWETIHG